MAYNFTKTLNRLNPFGKSDPNPGLPTPLPDTSEKHLVKVFVEGYEDVAFWRAIFDHFRNPYIRFEISVPDRGDLPKGKKVILEMEPRASEDMLLCVDSDFDYLFAGATETSRIVNDSPFLFHTYAYATENFLCYAPSLHNVCVKATKNDTRIFDFVRFLEGYSRTIYPLFVWYVFSARMERHHIFPLADFKAAVKLGYLDLSNNGDNTLLWLGRNVARRERSLREKNPHLVEQVERFEQLLAARGVTPETTYLYMNGHTLMDNVVMVCLQNVCDKLKEMSMARIHASNKTGIALKNEVANYKNATRSIRDVLLDNENYTDCPLYKLVERDIETYLERAIKKLKERRGKRIEDRAKRIER